MPVLLAVGTRRAHDAKQPFQRGLLERQGSHETANQRGGDYDSFHPSLSSPVILAILLAIQVPFSNSRAMRITDLVLHPIAIADPPLRSSYGLHAPFALRTIVELKTDSGLTGYSETYGGEGPLAGLEAVRHRVTGMDPFQLAGLYRDLTADAENQAANAPGGRSQTYLVPGENPLDRHTRTFAAI